MKNFEIPGRVQIISEPDSLPRIRVTSQASTAEVYLHGAHVTQFQKTGEPPLIFLSRKSFFTAGKAIRGGVPICFPWFGAREGNVMHGIARLSEWEVAGTAVEADGSVKLELILPESRLTQAGWPVAKVTFIVTVGATLTMELQVENTSAQDFVFEDCLHTYFAVGDISQVTIHGLKGVEYLDKTDNFARKPETSDAFPITGETDRVYLNTTGAVEIHDASFRRKISVEKSGSTSTVVWNPWIKNAQAMADFGADEYKEMVCVESGNVKDSQITLAPGKKAALKVGLRSEPLK
ncbi:MAG TPA: D-hexose-6-phosphate mutarotase [Verrucomicrobiae bacterium]|jgi:D-hexose-6-phosphate mutarotase